MYLVASETYTKSILNIFKGTGRYLLKKKNWNEN